MKNKMYPTISFGLISERFKGPFDLHKGNEMNIFRSARISCGDSLFNDVLLKLYKEIVK